jgi:hypothetical protein
VQYLFEKLEEEMSPLESISNQIAFAFADFRWKNLQVQDFSKIIKEEEPRAEIVSVTQNKKQLVVCFSNEEMQSEFRRLL